MPHRIIMPINNWPCSSSTKSSIKQEDQYLKQQWDWARRQWHMYEGSNNANEFSPSYTRHL